MIPVYNNKTAFIECKGVLFDLGGTLLDSLANMERAWTQFANKWQFDIKTILNYIPGKRAITSLRYFMVGASDKEIMQAFISLEEFEAQNTEGINALPGTRDLLVRLQQLAVPWGIVTSGSKLVAEARMAAAGLPMPEVFITAEQVKWGKPDPGAYQLGADRLGLHPDECVVIEDAQTGIQSGLSAGCKVIATNPAPDIPELLQVDWVLPTLEGLLVSKASTEQIIISHQSK